jgi:hypothetical protein
VHSGKIDTQFTEDPPTTDPEHNFLNQSLFLITGIEAGCDSPGRGIIPGDIGVQQVKRYLADIDPPYRNMNRGGNVGDFNYKLLAGTVCHTRHRSGITIEVLPEIVLPPIRKNTLVNVALRVHESNGHKRDAEVTAFLEMIAGKEAEPSCIERE